MFGSGLDFILVRISIRIFRGSDPKGLDPDLLLRGIPYCFEIILYKNRGINLNQLLLTFFL